jgi:hypothetical protein
MIFVIRFLLFVARPRRSGPFLRSPESSSSGKGLSEAPEAPQNQEKRREKSIAVAWWGRHCWESDEVMVRADGSRDAHERQGSRERAIMAPAVK